MGQIQVKKSAPLIRLIAEPKIDFDTLLKEVCPYHPITKLVDKANLPLNPSLTLIATISEMISPGKQNLLQVIRDGGYFCSHLSLTFLCISPDLCSVLCDLNQLKLKTVFKHPVLLISGTLQEFKDAFTHPFVKNFSFESRLFFDYLILEFEKSYEQLMGNFRKKTLKDGTFVFEEK